MISLSLYFLLGFVWPLVTEPEFVMLELFEIELVPSA